MKQYGDEEMTGAIIFGLTFLLVVFVILHRVNPQFISLVLKI